MNGILRGLTPPLMLFRPEPPSPEYAQAEAAAEVATGLATLLLGNPKSLGGGGPQLMINGRGEATLVQGMSEAIPMLVTSDGLFHWMASQGQSNGEPTQEPDGSGEPQKRDEVPKESSGQATATEPKPAEAKSPHTISEPAAPSPAPQPRSSRGPQNPHQQQDPFRGKDPDVPLWKLLQGKGKISDLTRHPNYEGVDTNGMVTKTLRQLKNELSNKQWDMLQKFFQDRPLRRKGNR